jgi:DNA polymerase-3 subunit delta'
MSIMAGVSVLFETRGVPYPWLGNTMPRAANTTVAAEPAWAAEIIGHDAVVAMLSRALSGTRIAHAYLFVGPERVGKATVARAMATALLGSRPDTHPDFTFVERERDAKTEKLHADITIAQVRQMIGRMSLGSLMSGWKVCVLDGAQLLNKESGNALLKTLEEPHPKTVLILTAPSAEQVLATVRSRCQVLRFGRVPSGVLAAALVARGVTADRAELFARLSGGRPGAALDFARDPDALRDMLALRTQILAMPGQRVAERFAAIEKAIPPKMPFQDALVAAGTWANVAAELLRDALLIRLGAGERIVHVDVYEQLSRWAANPAFDPAAALALVDSSRGLLDANVSPRGALERIAVAL